MKVRVKHVSGAAGPLRLDLPAGATLESLEEEVRSQWFPESAAIKVTLSLNKKNALEGDAGTTLKSLGCCTGDLVWVLEPALPPLGDAASHAASAPPRQVSAPAGASAGATPVARCGEPVASVPPGPQPASQEDAAVEAEEAEAEEEAEGEQEHLQPPCQTLPALLLRVLQSNAQAISAPVDVLVLAAHAAMLETGFIPTWAPASTHDHGAASSSKAPGEAEARAQRYALQPECWLSRSFIRMQYTYPDAESSNSIEGAAEGDSKMADVQAAPACTVDCSLMGGSVLVAACTPGGHLHHTSLAAQAFLSAVAARPLQQTEAETGPSSSAAAARVDPLPGNGLQLLSMRRQRLSLSAAAVKQLWRTLKDAIAFPMLLAVFSDAGLPPPAGLLALPEDLKQSLLECLPASDLAALSATCTGLRHLASADELWQPLVTADFPSISEFIRSQAKYRGWKWAYGQCWHERRQREAAARRQRRRMFAPALPRPFGPTPPFYPPPGRGFPGIVGGDYDRLPQFGGTAPGMFGVRGGTFGVGGSSSLRRGGQGFGAFGLF